MTTKSTKTKRTKTKTAAKPRPTAEVNTRAEGVGPYAPTIPAEFTIGRMLGGPPEPRVACVAAAVVALDAQTSNSGLAVHERGARRRTRAVVGAGQGVRRGVGRRG